MTLLLRIFIFVALFASSSSRSWADLLIPDSLRDRVIRVSAVDGTVIDQDFLFDNSLLTPINAIGSGRGTIFISDQVLDSVREYSLQGGFIRTVVAGGALDNIRGIAVHRNRLFVTVASGTFANTIQSFDLDGNDRRTFISTNLNSPWDITFRDNDAIVSNSGSDRIERFDLDGNFLGRFSNIELTFPQQINLTQNGDILVGNFSDSFYRFDGSGSLLASGGFGGVRGAFELENGQILYTAGTRLVRFDPLTGSNTEILNNNIPGSESNFRFIERVSFSTVPEPSSLTLMAGVLLFLRKCLRRKPSGYRVTA